LSADQRSELEDDLQQRRETITGTPADETKPGVVAGVRQGAADLATLPGEAALAADTATRVGDDIPEAVEERGVATVALSGSAIAGRTR